MLKREAQLLFLAAASGLGLVTGCSSEEIVVPPRIALLEDATAIECTNGGQVVVSGVDTNLDGALSDAEIVSRQPVCSGAAGSDGNPGSDGTSALLRVSEEAVGMNCAAGGVRIEAGADTNGDGALGDAEVTQTSFACDGPDGAAGLASLVRTRPDTGVLCEGGGLIIEFGLDADGDGVLDDEEVQRAEAVCEGGEGRTGLTSISDEPAGANCVVGGQRVDVGVDLDASGALESAEITSTEYVCDPVRTAVRVSPELAGTSTACPGTGGARIETGPDLDDDGQLDAAEVRETTYVCSGAGGGQSLVAVTPEPAGMSCPSGGNRIVSGPDANGNGVLDPAEIISTSFVCNGREGQDGSGGNAVRVSSEPAGNNCSAGGVRIQTGPDTNGNGALDDAEVTSTSYACRGVSTQTLVATATEPAGANCANGGVRIDQGLDDDGDGVLDAGEIDSSSYVCDTNPGTSVPFQIRTTALPDVVDVAPYNVTLTAFGGTGGSYAWSISSGMLPPGLTLGAMGTPSTTLSGMSTAAGSYTFTVRVTDFFGQSAEQQYTISVGGPPCSPGQGGAVGQSLTAITVPSSFSGSVRGMAADRSTAGWVYFVEPNLGLNRFSKDGTRKEDDIHTNISGLSAGDIGYEMDIDGADIYLTSDDTSCTGLCVYRVSDDGGQTFTVQNVGDFSGGAPNDDLRGIAVRGTTMWVITHDFDETELYEIDLSGTLPAVPVRRGTYPNLEYCSGLEVDRSYLYTVCSDVDGNSNPGVARISLTTFAGQALVATPSFFTVGSDIISAVYGQDLNADGDFDIMFVTGDSGDDFYLCTPAAASTGAFGLEWLTGFSGDDEGMAFDRSNGVLYKVDELSTSAAAFQ